MQFDSVACSIVVLLFIIDDVDTNSDDVWKTVQFIVNNHGANIIITLYTFYTVVISIFRKVLQYAKGPLTLDFKRAKDVLSILGKPTM